MNIFLDTIGCRLNQSEIEKMASQFRAAGHNIVSAAKDADMVVVNTCAVTTAAASDSRQAIRQAAADFASAKNARLCRIPQGANALGLSQHGVLPTSRDAQSMLREPRRVDHTICTAVAPEAVFTVRT